MANLIKKMLEDSGLSFGDSTDPQKKGVTCDSDSEERGDSIQIPG